MGTTSCAITVAQVREELIRQSNFDKLDERGNRYYSKVLATHNADNGLWVLCEQDVTVYWDENRFQRLNEITAHYHRITHSKGISYWKSFDIHEGPYAYRCPKAWLDQIQPHDQHGERWLETARAVHAGMRKVIPGQRFKYMDGEWSVVAHHGGEWWRVRNPDGMLYRLRPRTIQECPLIELQLG